MDPLQLVADALQAGDKQKARTLLKPLLASNPDLETYLLAAQAQETPSASIHFLQQAQALDPDNQMVADFLQQMQAQEQQIESSRQSIPIDQPVGVSQSLNVAPSGSSVKGERIFEMLWDCHVCGTKKLLAKSQRFCPNCGAPQNPASRYFPSDEDKTEVFNHKYVGKDKTCASCGELNAADSQFCQNCGAPLDNAIEATTIGSQTRSESDHFESSGSRDLVQEKWDSQMQRIQADSLSQKRKIPWIPIALVVLVIAVLGAIFVAMNWKKNVSLTVDGHSWERVITIEEFSAVRSGSWDEMVPIGAYNQVCSRRVRDHRMVDTGRETCQTVRTDRGDGTFSEQRICQPIMKQEPIYDQWCDYTINTWVKGRSVTTTGGLEDPLIWGEPKLNCANQNRLGCEREGGRNQTLLVKYSSEDNKFECAFEEAKWRSFEPGSRWSALVHVIGGGLDCNSIEQR